MRRKEGKTDMKYASNNIRNILIAGHAGSGKTTLTEALVYFSGAAERMGRVEDGTTISDFFAPPKFFAIFRHNAQPYRFAPPLTSTCTKQRREVWRPIRQNFQTKYLKFVLSVVLSL